MKTNYIIAIFILLTALSCSSRPDFSRPVPAEDEYWHTPQSNYEERRDLFLTYCIQHGDKTGLRGVFTQVARLLAGMETEEEYVQEVIDLIRSNRDCTDFVMNGLLRMQYMEQKKPTLSAETSEKVKDCILDFKYWWNDSRQDTTYRCYHTENHQALFHTAELLAGQLYKDQIFSSGLTGRQHMEHAEYLLERWLDFRFRFGFSEWLSGYYEVNILLLVNLYDHAENPALRTRAEMVLNLLMYDMALNQFHGSLSSTSGRIYASSLLHGSHSLSPTLKLLFGEGVFLPHDIMSNVALCGSKYRCPDIITGIATDYNTPLLNYQKTSMEVEDAPLYGLAFDREEDVHLYWQMQEFIHPQVVRMSKEMSGKYGTYPYKNYDHYIDRYEQQIKEHGKVVNNRLDRFALSEANIVTYRTDGYMVSCAMDYRKGAIAYQQHIWQASLDNRAIVYTNHPGGMNLRNSPNYWAGNEALPRAAQHNNIVVCIYNSPQGTGKDITHAYFPKDAFEEVREMNGWYFGKKGDGYIALYSQNPATWKRDEEGVVKDLVAEGRQNSWICETGNRQQWGSFEEFVEKIAGSEVICVGSDVSYHSPLSGKIEFGWEKEFRVNGEITSLKTGYRYDNPYSKTPFASREVRISSGKILVMDFEKATIGYE